MNLEQKSNLYFMVLEQKNDKRTIPLKKKYDSLEKDLLKVKAYQDVTEELGKVKKLFLKDSVEECRYYIPLLCNCY